MPTKQRMVATMNPAAHIEKWNQRLIVLTVVMLISAMLISACGSGGSSQSGQPAAAPGETRAAVPTVPQARFAQPTTMISTNTAITMTSTATATVAATQAVESAATPTVDLNRGATVYANRGCGECHGAQGEGVEGKGSALAGTTLSEAEFTDILRTGANGELGPSHLYGPNAISPGGMTALHAWLVSLGQ
jgi:mono/diheme cytochrome c family protein